MGDPDPSGRPFRRWLRKRRFVQLALTTPPDPMFRQRPPARVIVGLVLLGASYLVAWPAITVLGAAAAWLRAPKLLPGCTDPVRRLVADLRDRARAHRQQVGERRARAGLGVGSQAGRALPAGIVAVESSPPGARDLGPLAHRLAWQRNCLVGLQCNFRPKDFFHENSLGFAFNLRCLLTFRCQCTRCRGGCDASPGSQSRRRAVRCHWRVLLQRLCPRRPMSRSRRPRKPSRSGPPCGLRSRPPRGWAPRSTWS